MLAKASAGAVDDCRHPFAYRRGTISIRHSYAVHRAGLHTAVRADDGYRPEPIAEYACQFERHMTRVIRHWRSLMAADKRRWADRDD